MVTQTLRFQQHIIFHNHSSGARNEMWMNTHCFLTLELEEWPPSGRIQQFQSFNTVHTNVSDTSNNKQSNIEMPRMSFNCTCISAFAILQMK
jgi:hypothetical protein